MPLSSDLFPITHSGSGGGLETDPIATVVIKTLSDAVALLPTNATIAPIKADITQLQSDVLKLASKDDLIKANDALALVTAAVKKLETDGSEAARKALEDAIAKANIEITALKTKQDATTESLQKATQSIADLAILVAGGAGGASSTELKALQDKLTALDKDKADKTALDTLDTTVTALKTALADGATDKELADAIAKVDAAIALIESALKPLEKRTLYTTTTVLNALVGDEIHIDGEGDIQLPPHPPDGADVWIFDSLGKIKAGKNNVLLGSGDHWLLLDGTYDTTPLDFIDNQFQRGRVRLKYSAPDKYWWPYILYGTLAPTSPSSTGGDRLVTALLALLPANQWTDWPALTGTDAGKSITLDSIQSSSGDDWTNRLEVDRVRQRVRSLSSYADVQFTYEVH